MGSLNRAFAALLIGTIPVGCCTHKQQQEMIISIDGDYTVDSWRPIIVAYKQQTDETLSLEAIIEDGGLIVRVYNSSESPAYLFDEYCSWGYHQWHIEVQTDELAFGYLYRHGGLIWIYNPIGAYAIPEKGQVDIPLDTTAPGSWDIFRGLLSCMNQKWKVRIVLTSLSDDKEARKSGVWRGVISSDWIESSSPQVWLNKDRFPSAPLSR